MKWYIKSSLGMYWGGPGLGWIAMLGRTVPRFHTPNDAMTELLACRTKDDGKPIIYTCGIQILPETN